MPRSSVPGLASRKRRRWVLWARRALGEVFFLSGAGFILAFGGLKFFEYVTRQAYDFGRIELAYLPESEIHRVYLSIEYEYRGGCAEIAWTHTAANDLGKVVKLGSYQGPPIWGIVDEPGLYQTVIDIPEPMKEGVYEWRGLMICIAKDGKQTPIRTTIERLHVDHSIIQRPGRTPLSWLRAADLFTPL